MWNVFNIDNWPWMVIALLVIALEPGLILVGLVIALIYFFAVYFEL